jgi:hypothetical protein
MLETRRKIIQTQIDKYSNGFTKITETEGQVDGMK